MKSLQEYIYEANEDTSIKDKIIKAIESHEDDINNYLTKYDSYLYLCVCTEMNAKGDDWHSHNDEADSIEWIIEDIKTNELENTKGKNITDWNKVKSWYLECWENKENENDVLLKHWIGNL